MPSERSMPSEMIGEKAERTNARSISLQTWIRPFWMTVKVTGSRFDIEVSLAQDGGGHLVPQPPLRRCRFPCHDPRRSCHDPGRAVRDYPADRGRHGAVASACPRAARQAPAGPARLSDCANHLLSGLYHRRLLRRAPGDPGNARTRADYASDKPRLLARLGGTCMPLLGAWNLLVARPPGEQGVVGARATQHPGSGFLRKRPQVPGRPRMDSAARSLGVLASRARVLRRPGLCPSAF